MQKRLLILFLAVMMAISFSACDDKKDTAANDNAKQPTEGKDAFTDLPSGDYARLMYSENFYMTYTMYAMGMDFEGSQAVSGDILASKVTIDNKVLFTIIDNDKMYDINADTNSYTVTQLSTDELSNYKTDYKNMTYVKSGSGAIASLISAGVGSINYHYDEYHIKVDLTNKNKEDADALKKAGINDDSNVTIRYYLKDDDSLYAISCTVMNIETVMLVHELTDQVPDDMLKIPDGYTEVSTIE